MASTTAFLQHENPFSFLHVSCIVVVVVLLLKTSGKPMIIFLSKSFLWSDCKWEYVYGGFLGASQPYIMGALLLCKLFVPFILVTYMTKPKHSCYDSLLTKTAEVVTYPYKSPFNISSIEEHCDTHKLTLCNCGFWFTVPLETVTSFLCACNITGSMMIYSGGVCFVVSQLCFQCSYKSTRTPTTWVLLHRPLTFRCHDNTFLLPCKPPHIFSLQISSMLCTVLDCFAPTWGPVEKSFFLFGHMHWVGWT